MFSDYKHYIACFKDIKFESVCREMKEVTLTKGEIESMLSVELRKLES